MLMKHGIREPFFGVKVEDLKTIQKKIKKNYLLSKELYDTENADARVDPELHDVAQREP